MLLKVKRCVQPDLLVLMPFGTLALAYFFIIFDGAHIRSHTSEASESACVRRATWRASFHI